MLSLLYSQDMQTKITKKSQMVLCAFGFYRCLSYKSINIDLLYVYLYCVYLFVDHPVYTCVHIIYIHIYIHTYTI